MSAMDAPPPRFETERLVLRAWRPEEAGVLRELWAERDPRVPPYRRIDAEGRPTVDDLATGIRDDPPERLGLLALELPPSAEVIGYCGLVDQGHDDLDAPELAFELFRRAWGRGYATEASAAVLEWARSSGFGHLWATVWDWNAASRRVLEKLGFAEVGREAREHGTMVVTRREL
jgi:[ribosomal protein S5]-alanine N-acetyltransferase